MAFKKIDSLDPHGGPILRTEVLGNSVQAVIGRSVQTVDAGSIVLGTAGALVFGHINSIVTADGVSPTVNGNSGNFTMFYLSASTNSSSGGAGVQAVCDVSKYSMYSADPDATIDTTYGSGKIGFHTDITNSDDTDESTATAATAQYFIWGIDPADSGNQVVNIYESEVFGV